MAAAISSRLDNSRGSVCATSWLPALGAQAAAWLGPSLSSSLRGPVRRHSTTSSRARRRGPRCSAAHAPILNRRLSALEYAPSSSPEATHHVPCATPTRQIAVLGGRHEHGGTFADITTRPVPAVSCQLDEAAETRLNSSRVPDQGPFALAVTLASRRLLVPISSLSPPSPPPPNHHARLPVLDITGTTAQACRTTSRNHFCPLALSPHSATHAHRSRKAPSLALLQRQRRQAAAVEAQHRPAPSEAAKPAAASTTARGPRVAVEQSSITRRSPWGEPQSLLRATHPRDPRNPELAIATPSSRHGDDGRCPGAAAAGQCHSPQPLASNDPPSLRCARGRSFNRARAQHRPVKRKRPAGTHAHQPDGGRATAPRHCNGSFSSGLIFHDGTDAQRPRTPVQQLPQQAGIHYLWPGHPYAVWAGTPGPGPGPGPADIAPWRDTRSPSVNQSARDALSRHVSLTSRGYDSDGMQHVLEPDRMTASTQSMPGSVVEPLAMSIARRLPHQLQQQQVPPEAVEFAGVTSMSPGAGRARDKIYDAILQQNFRLLADQGGQQEHRSQLCSETAAVEAFDPAAAIYCSGLAPDQAQVLGQAVSSSGTPARAGSCVTGPVEGTPTSLPNGMTSTQVSSAEESTIRYQSQALPAASLSQPGVAHGSLAAFFSPDRIAWQHR
ncbi:hypothetical protein ACCO45_013404 [Purpureocillium lilacinum]|uniref:Uncharacterized protein n=1 Tax=Purpureocillium lilacinum TaxID=33203 RepID=A0ACC4D6I1_PURLI